MKFPSNINYLFSRKENEKLPDYFNDFLLNNSVGNYIIKDIEELRTGLLLSDKLLDITDFGAGSRIGGNRQRKISDIVKHSSTPEKYGNLLNKIVRYFEIKNILEFGTSLGIGTAYLAGNNNIEKIISIDACENSQNIADKNLKKLQIKNYQLINDSFDNILDNQLLKDQKFDLIFIDGNHRGDALIKYYNQLSKKKFGKRCILIFDDINWSADMFNTWKKITKNHKNNCILDIYRMGIIFYAYNELPEGYYKTELKK